jgi:hypothetical protein
MIFCSTVQTQAKERRPKRILHADFNLPYKKKKEEGN